MINLRRQYIASCHALTGVDNSASTCSDCDLGDHLPSRAEDTCFPDRVTLTSGCNAVNFLQPKNLKVKNCGSTLAKIAQLMVNSQFALPIN